MRGHLKVVKVLLDAGSEIDKEDGDYSTALILAIKEGYYNIANYLITSGASVVKKDRNGWTALLYATKMGHLETVKAIVEAGAEIDDMSRDHFTPLMLAVRTKQIPIIVYLLESGADITKQDKSGLTRKSEVGRFSRKADTQLARGKRTLSYAINHRHRSAAKVLITHGVSIEGLLSTSPPMTALMWTAQEGDDSLTEERC
jgi:ankyrin repeat protein